MKQLSYPVSLLDANRTAHLGHQTQPITNPKRQRGMRVNVLPRLCFGLMSTTKPRCRTKMSAIAGTPSPREGFERLFHWNVPATPSPRPIPPPRLHFRFHTPIRPANQNQRTLGAPELKYAGHCCLIQIPKVGRTAACIVTLHFAGDLLWHEPSTAPEALEIPSHVQTP